MEDQHLSRSILARSQGRCGMETGLPPMFGHVAELVTVDRLLNIAVDAEGILANYVGLFVRTGAARLPGESVCGIGLQLQCCTPMHATYQS
jgi:hypothetical protein